jgi:hypothetical protein
MVARDGIEPPTPAFSGLASSFTGAAFHPRFCWLPFRYLLLSMARILDAFWTQQNQNRGVSFAYR